MKEKPAREARRTPGAPSAPNGRETRLGTGTDKRRRVPHT